MQVLKMSPTLDCWQTVRTVYIVLFLPELLVPLFADAKSLYTTFSLALYLISQVWAHRNTWSGMKSLGKSYLFRFVERTFSWQNIFIFSLFCYVAVVFQSTVLHNLHYSVYHKWLNKLQSKVKHMHVYLHLCLNAFVSPLRLFLYARRCFD